MLFRRCRALKYDLSESLRTENSQGLVAAYLHGLDGYAALVLPGHIHRTKLHLQ